jgi:hypothetical protein
MANFETHIDKLLKSLKLGTKLGRMTYLFITILLY